MTRPSVAELLDDLAAVRADLDEIDRHERAEVAEVRRLMARLDAALLVEQADAARA